MGRERKKVPTATFIEKCCFGFFFKAEANPEKKNRGYETAQDTSGINKHPVFECHNQCSRVEKR